MRNVSTSSSAFAESGSSITILIWLTVETRHSWVPRNVGWKLSWRFFLGRTYDTKTFYGLKLATLNTWYRVNYFSQSFPEGVQSCFFLVQYRPTPATELSEVVMQKLFQSVCVLFFVFFCQKCCRAETSACLHIYERVLYVEQWMLILDQHLFNAYFRKVYSENALIIVCVHVVDCTCKNCYPPQQMPVHQGCHFLKHVSKCFRVFYDCQRLTWHLLKIIYKLSLSKNIHNRDFRMQYCCLN